jgi:hypothetical protein
MTGEERASGVDPVPAEQSGLRPEADLRHEPRRAASDRLVQPRDGCGASLDDADPMMPARFFRHRAAETFEFGPQPRPALRLGS